MTRSDAPSVPDVPPPSAPPEVTVVVPVRNEARTIGPCLRSLFLQDLAPERFEILVVDGNSTDGTADAARAFRASLPAATEARALPELRVLANLAGDAASAMNTGILAARGAVIVRLDGHATAAPDFLRRSLDALRETGAACVGGVLTTVGEGARGRAVAIAMSTRLGAGSATFRTGTGRGTGAEARRDTDTVAFGACRRELLTALGGYDPSFLRNQDDELNLRITRNGGRIVLDPAIRATYVCRRGPFAAARQYFGYGFHKVRVLALHGRLGSWRAAAPAALVAVLAGSLVATCWLQLTSAAHGSSSEHAASGSPGDAALLAAAPLLAYAALLLCGSVAAALARRAPGALPFLPAAYAALHLGYGAGFWCGVLSVLRRVPEPCRDPRFADARTRIEELRATYARFDAPRAANGTTGTDPDTVTARSSRPPDDAEPAQAAHAWLLADRARALRRLGGDAGAPGPVLDLGCGRGTSLATLEALSLPLGGTRPVGVDVLPERLPTRERTTASHARFLCADGVALPFRDGVFDVVLLFTTLGSMASGDPRSRTAAEALRVLRPGGRVLVYDLRRRRPGGEGGSLRRDEVRALFPGCIAVCGTTGLLPPLLRGVLRVLGPRAGGAAARGLAGLPFLRSHRVAVVRKDPPPPPGLPRALDAAVAAVTLLLASPLLLVCAVAVAGTSRGGILHRAVRSGRHGRPFTILKFRTMRTGVPGPGITGGGDPRVTHAGRLLRALHLDELPQLWNVLRGDMALVGPRPEDARFADLRDPRWRRILSVRPGITGWTQLTFSPYEHERLRGVPAGDVERVYHAEILPAKLACEVRAVDERTPWNDLLCLLRTPERVLGAFFRRDGGAAPGSVPRTGPVPRTEDRG